MRDIKFKFYLKEPGTEEIIVKTFDYSAIFSGTAKRYFNEQLPGCYIIGKSLFTGLKDIEDIEIFGGDKIQVDEYYIGDNLQNPFIGEVRYSNGSYEVADSENAACEELNRESITNYSMKVIGNIFEN